MGVERGGGDRVVGGTRDRVHALGLRRAPVGRHQVLVQRLEELPPSLRREEALERRHGGLVAMPDGNPEPGKQHLAVAARAEAEGAIQIRQLRRRHRGRQRPEKVLPLLCGPGRRLEVRGCRAAGEARHLAFDDAEGVRGRRGRVVGQARFLEPRVELQRPLEPRIARDEVRAEVLEKLRRRQRRERVAVEVAAQPDVEARTAHSGLDHPHERRALVVCDRRDPVIGIATGEVDVQDLVAGFVLERGQLAGQLAAPEDFEHPCAPLAVQLLHDPVFEVGGEPLVEPEVAPRRVGHQVAGPRVRQLVRDERGERAVAGQDRRRRKGDARILHAAKRERRRQHQHVVAAPAVRAAQCLGSLDHLLDVGKLRRGPLHDGGLGVDTRCAVPRAQK